MILFTCSACGSQRQIYESEFSQRKTALCRKCMYVLRGARNVHGWAKKHKPLYMIWLGVTSRIDQKCPSHKVWTHYQGLDMDPAWRDVGVFIQWMLEHGWTNGMSIERIDNERGYWPDNCKIIPRILQGRNRRTTKLTEDIAREVKARVAAGEIRFQVAKDVAAKTGMPLRRICSVAYGTSWMTESGETP